MKNRAGTQKPEKPNRHAERSEHKKSKEQARAEKKRATELKTAEKRRAAQIKNAEKRRIAELKAKRRKRLYAAIKRKLKNRQEGFDYNNFGIFQRLELEVRGDGTSAVSRLAANGIEVSDIVKDGIFVRFKLRKKDLAKAVAILDEMCYTHRVYATYGMGKRCTFWLARVGLILGAAASVACMYISYGYVWRINISGNEKLSVAEITSALNAAGIRPGLKKSACNLESLNTALENLRGVADASCEIRGTTLDVHVLEASDYDVHTKYGAYVSEYDATVTRIVMRSGTATVHRGDVVKYGDVLASGDVFSTSGELLYTADCDAEVYGNVSLTFTAEIPTVTVEYKRTGRSTRKTVLRMFGMNIGKSRSPYASYETSAHTANYDVLLPVYVTSYEFFETKPIERERDVDEAARQFAEAKLENLRFGTDFEYSYTVDKSVAGLYKVHLFVSGETLISKGIDAK